MPKVVFSDKMWLNADLEELYKTAFKKVGVDFETAEWKTEDDAIKNGKKYDAILTVNVPFTRKVLESLPALKMIGRCGIGVDNVDLDAAAELGIAVCNVPDYCVHEVALHSLALLLTFARGVPIFAAHARTGGYGPGGKKEVRRLKGQVLGLLGYGRIARELAGMAKGLGMNIAVYDPYVTSVSDANVTLYKKVDEVLAVADYVSVHVPLTPETKHIINADTLRKMKKSAVIINTSRGGVIDKTALMEALKKKTIAGAGLDVCEGEPLQPGDPLYDISSAVFTPHVAMYSEESMVQLHENIAAQTIDALAKKWPNNVVNKKVEKNWRGK